MKPIPLNNINYFKDEQRLLKLNRLLRVRKLLMLHDVQIATGCNELDALTVLLLLFHAYLAEAFLFVYHKDHLDPPVTIERRRLSEGLPKVPFNCFVCEKEIIDLNDLYVDFAFKLSTDDIEFVS